MATTQRLLHAALAAAGVLFDGREPHAIRCRPGRALLRCGGLILELHCRRRIPRRAVRVLSTVARPPQLEQPRPPLSRSAQALLDHLRQAAARPMKFAALARALDREADGGDFRAARAELIASGLIYRPYPRDHRWWPVDRPLPAVGSLDTTTPPAAAPSGTL